jgi:endonuclease YncB( thermonuclease family)
MMGLRGGISIVLFAIACGCCGATAQEQPTAATPCGGETVARGAVGRIIDGRTFVLDDGREVRLAAIEVPPLPMANESGAAPGAEASKDALAGLLAGAEVILRRAEFPVDRYGRVFAYAYTVRDGGEQSVQAGMISAGFARVGDRVGARNCASDLLDREAAARRARLGLWADSYYEVLDAGSPVDVAAQLGQFALVEGKVVSVRESGATIYVNFGRRWSEDFTVTIQKRNERSFRAAGLDLKGLTDRRIRVRGWIEERGGPWIEAAHPEQIEVDDRE